LDDLLAAGVHGRPVLVRADLSVPCASGTILDDRRIRAVLPTLTALREAGAKVVVCSHLGPPGRPPDRRRTLAPVAARLAELLGSRIAFATDTVGWSAHRTVAGLAAGDVALLENLRYHPEESSPDPATRAGFAAHLSALAEAYVNDAFATVHRRHASVCEVPARLPGYAGHLVARELAALRRLTGPPVAPYLVAVGGAKVVDKLALVSSLLPAVDRLLVGGAMCLPFLAAQGADVGARPMAPGSVETCRGLLARYPGRILLPVDLVVADRSAADARRSTVPVARVPAGWLGMDIGPATVECFTHALCRARTVFWNGPMGVFEWHPFAAGTRGTARAVATAAGFTVLGGGDTSAALHRLGFPDSAFDHVSTGGGATLAYLAGEILPGIAALAAATATGSRPGRHTVGTGDSPGTSSARRGLNSRVRNGSDHRPGAPSSSP
jgi:phosphoglycerate kinase